MLRDGRGVQRECARMGEAVEHLFALRDLHNGTAVVLLVEEEARFLTVDVIHQIADAVLGDLHLAAQVGTQSFQREKALVFLEPFQLAHLDVVALIDRVDCVTAFFQYVDQQSEDHFLHAVGA